MQEYCRQNKRAWEYNAYDFWVNNTGKPIDRAKEALENPLRILKRYADYFDTYEGIKVANICGSCGKKAIPLALLGSEVTIFDISEDNKRYALEVAEVANVDIDFIVGDVLDINMNRYNKYFDVVFMEGGVLHYFHDVNQFMKVMNQLLRPGGKMICSDFHPFQKISDILELEQPTMSYFSTDVFEGEMAHARFYSDEIRKQMPLCSYRKYTISEIVNAVIDNGFILSRFDEHPAWNNRNVPGEFTIIARKNDFIP
jgi:2-polyprenyl-3-methyl-5-hydroxy-6-metoxy-1,4-benzoquinol methylase